MNNNESEEFKENFAQFMLFRSALTKESDRGCALFAAAYIDKALSDLLCRSLVESNKIDDELLKGNAPLASFSSRIKMAFYLGKISSSCRRDLDLIRKIRNDFAHNAADISFETEAIGNKCRELTFSYQAPDARPRAHFTAACAGLLGTIQMIGVHAVAPKQAADNPPTAEDKAQHRDLIFKQFQELAGNVSSTPDA
jgi:hypothetical protein